jgi:hypothetical protein
MDSAVGAFGQSFFDGLFGAFGTHGDGHDFAALFFFQAQRFFEREAVRLIRFEADVGFADPRAAFDDGERRILGGNLFDADSDFQIFLLAFPTTHKDSRQQGKPEATATFRPRA